MCKFNMFITAVCVLFLIKLRWPKNKSIKLLYSIYLQRWVKKYTSDLYFLKNKGVWLRTLSRETKVSNYKTCIELQNLAWKVKLSHKMNESRHNQYIKPKVLSYYLKLKTAISHFVFQIFHVNKLWWFVSSLNLLPCEKQKCQVTICN